MNKELKNVQISKNYIGFILITIFVIIMAFMTVYTIDAGEKGVLLTFGKVNPNPMEQGFHMKIPIAQTITKFEIRTKKIESEADSASKDLQDVQTTIALNYHLVPSEVTNLYQSVGLHYQERIIDPAIQESVKAVTARYVAEELITKRPKVRNDMKDLIREKLVKYHIAVDDFNIVNFQFSEEFDKAIEQKVTAEQLKLKAERDLERIKIEKEQIIAKAQAEAESLRLQKQEITPDLIKLRQIEVQRFAINKWNGILPQVTGNAIPFIDIRESERTLINSTL